MKTGRLKIAPSIMCSDFRRLEAEVYFFEKEGVDFLHIDVMDGHFVPNITLGPPVVRAISEMTKLPLDIHMMVSRPESFIPVMCPGNGSIMTVHAEASRDIPALLAQIREAGDRPGIAINPATPVSAVEDWLHLADVVLVMTVNPGFAGQTLVPETLDKIRGLAAVIAEKGLSTLIEADGNTSFENIRLMREAGADIIVAGTSCLYRKGSNLAQSLADLQAFIATL